MEIIPLNKDIKVSVIRSIINSKFEGVTLPNSVSFCNLYDNKTDVITPRMPDSIDTNLNLSNWKGAALFTGVITVEPTRVTVNLIRDKFGDNIVIVRLKDVENVRRRSQRKLPGSSDTINFIIENFVDDDPIGFIDIVDGSTLTTLTIANSAETSITHSFTGLKIISTQT